MEKQRWEESKRRREEEKSESQKKEDAGAGKGKVAIHRVFPMICGSGGSKSRLAKVAGAHLQVKKLKSLHVRSTFGS
jgi:hypothetical protein